MHSILSAYDDHVFSICILNSTMSLWKGRGKNNFNFHSSENELRKTSDFFARPNQEKKAIKEKRTPPWISCACRWSWTMVSGSRQKLLLHRVF